MLGIKIQIELHIHLVREERKGAPSASREQGQGKPPRENLIVLARRKAEALKTAVSPSTFENYLTSLRSLERFLLRPLRVEELSADLMRSYERWLREQHICQNTISCYMRSLRSLFSKVCGSQAASCFEEVYTGRMKTEKRAVGMADINRLKELQLSRGSYLALTRDLFLFSFYALGMPFVDLCFLRRAQIRNGELVYSRHKTGQPISVHLEQPMLDILDRYSDDRRDYVFPLLTSDDPDAAYSQYQQQLGRYNRALKRLAAKAGINHRLTSYTARHTWASVAFQRNVDLPVISKALGHTNPQNTLIYIQQINDHRLQQANSQILNLVMGNE